MSKTKTAPILLPLGSYSVGRSWLAQKVIPRKTNHNAPRITATGELRIKRSESVRIGFIGLDQQRYHFCYHLGPKLGSGAGDKVADNSAYIFI